MSSSWTFKTAGGITLTGMALALGGLAMPADPPNPAPPAPAAPVNTPAAREAVSPADADLAFRSLNKVYWDQGTRFFHKEERGAKKADFWLEAQLWDTVMDQYDRHPSDEVKRQINDVYDGFVHVYPDWTTNKYNDDIMWWAIACARAYDITRDDRYLKKAQQSFDFVYDHFADAKAGGGIYWTSEKTSKNSCINSPAVIAAVRLAALLKSDAYLEKAKALYAWQRKTLTDGHGKVYDSIRIAAPRRGDPVRTFSLTYNQGTFIGAGVLLYQQTKDSSYLDDAVRAAQWTRDNLCITDQHILRPEGQGDGGAFKGIFVRYMKLLVRVGGRSEFLPWMQANAASAWRNRRASDNIMGENWSSPTGAGVQSQTAASAVSALLCFPEAAPSAPPALPAGPGATQQEAR